MKISKRSAQQIVEEIGKLVKQNINLMDETGRITFLRLAVTGQTNSPDLYTVMQILGTDHTKARIRAAMDSLD